MTDYVRGEAEFLKDVAEHQMKVIRDDGVNRHVVFKRPGTRCYQFELITWPGYLCYTGDMGTFVFQRLEDMFEFFRADRGWQNLRDGRTLAINPGYWSQKLESADKNGGFEEFSEEKFKRAVLGDLIKWIGNHRDETTKEQRRELWDDVMCEVIDAYGDNGGHRKQAAAHDFSHIVKDRLTFSFQDFFERNVTDYTHRFMWCCLALAWGVKKYDEAKGGAA